MLLMILYKVHQLIKNFRNIYIYMYTEINNMGFFGFLNKVKGFLNKTVHKASNFGGKVLHGLDKGLHVVGNIADQASGALEGVPVIGELAGAARTFIKYGKGLIHMTQGGIHDVQKINNKFGKLRMK